MRSFEDICEAYKLNTKREKIINYSDVSTSGKGKTREKKRLFYDRYEDLDDKIKYATAAQSNIGGLLTKKDLIDGSIKQKKYVYTPSLKYFRSEYTNFIMSYFDRSPILNNEKLWKEEDELFEIDLTMGSLGIGMEQDTVFHQVRKNIFLDDIIKIGYNKEQLIIYLKKDNKFFEIMTSYLKEIKSEYSTYYEQLEEFSEKYLNVNKEDEKGKFKNNKREFLNVMDIVIKLFDERTRAIMLLDLESRYFRRREKETPNLQEERYIKAYESYIKEKEHSIKHLNMTVENLLEKEISYTTLLEFYEEMKVGKLYDVLNTYGQNGRFSNFFYDLGNNDQDAYSTIKETNSDPSQIIYVGAPGVGKSFKIEKKTKIVSEVNKIRTVFHPDYENHDFVGSILPVVSDSNVTYEFKPGPFTRCLMQAHKSPEKDYYLIIEEITRGNASAIFGEVFQLLDRDENGVSKYPINNEDMAKAIYGSEAKKDNYQVVIPQNVSILATANTSDQNVFVLDTAFKRRFEFEYLDVEAEEGTELPEVEIFGQSWEDIYMIFNNFIVEELEMAEDKQIGPFFIQKQDEIAKLCRYLWEDIDKANYVDEKSIFSSEYSKRFASINKLCKEGMLKGNEKNKDVLSKEFLNYLDKKMSENISSDFNEE